MKVSLGKDTGKKYRHNLNSNVYTTARVGFVQPINCRELCAQDTIKVRSASAVYLNPVAKPTFGRLAIKQYKNFVPIEEIWHPFGSMMVQKPYSGAVGGSYIPTAVPNLPLSYITFMVYMCSVSAVFSLSDVDGDLYRVSFSNAVQETTAGTFTAAWSQMLYDIANGTGADSSSIIESAILYCRDRNLLIRDSEQYSVTDIARFDWYFLTSDNKLVCGRFTERGKNLRKILLGLGYQLSMCSDTKTLLPIVAFYKSWFDLFAVQRDITWKDTSCFGWLEYNEQSGYGVARLDSTRGRQFCSWFFESLPQTYFTISPDFASAHISQLGINKADSRTMQQATSAGGIVTSSVAAGDNLTPVLPTNVPVSQEGLNILRALYERVNKKTAIGGRIKDFMRAVFGSQYDQEDESMFIGASSFNIDITQVMSTAETELGSLGEYAGKGLGDNFGEYYTFTARKQGYYVEFFAIVPDSRLAQAVDPNLSHVTRTQFYDPKFDSVTLLPSRKSSIYGTNDFARQGSIGTLDSGFGNVPAFMEYKVSFDKINGDMSMASTRTSYLPFTLAKLLPYTRVHVPDNPTVDDPVKIQNVNSNILVTGDMWRYIGRDRWVGNFDRLFINDGGTWESFDFSDPNPHNLEYRVDDNYVLYFYCDFDLSGFELPISASWNTGAEQGDTISVQKA